MRLPAPLLVLAVVASACSALPARAEVVRQSIEPAPAGVGEPVRYEVVFRGARDDVIEDPVFVSTPGEPLEIVEQSVRRSRPFLRGRTVTFVCMLRSFSPGTYDVPELTIRHRPEGSSAWQSASVPAQTVEIRSALAGEQGEPRLKDIKGPFSSPGEFGLLLAALVLLAVLAVVFGAVRKKKAQGPPAAEPEPAHVIALRELDLLARKDLVRQGFIQDYFVEVSSIVRRYLERRFSVHAPEMTTEEFLLVLRDDPVLSGAYRALLEDFLGCCDLVKFARYAPQNAEIEEVFASARRFVEQTRPPV